MTTKLASFIAALSAAALSVADAASVTVGDTRVTALSETLVRIEQKGPAGFFDEPSFNVVGRAGFDDGLPISELNKSAAGTWLATSAYHVFVPAGAAPAACTGSDCTSTLSGATVATPSGKVLYKGANTFTNASLVAANHLHWPSPLDAPSYAFNDFPRFTVPAWGPTPIPADAKVPADLVAMNGFDFTNNVDGDTYVFLLGEGSLEGWWKGRADFMTLTGPTPLLPDFAYGIWYTWYVVYTEQRAKHEVGNWTAAKFPLDVWGLDMNWRNVGANEGSEPGTATSVALCRKQTKEGAQPTCRSHFYDHPDTDLLPGLTMTETQKGSVVTVSTHNQSPPQLDLQGC